LIETITIPHRYNGPATTGNGGYSAGVVAGLLERAPSDAIRVTLRRPPPLETELTVRHDGPAVAVLAGDDVVAQAEPDGLPDDDVISTVGFDEASAVARAYPGFAAHPFPTCFVCGPAREPDDGLRIYPGRLGDGRTAAPFVVPEDISPVLLWAALDCPGGWAAPQDVQPYVLGQITARIVAMPLAGDHCVAMGELLSEQGRRAFVRTAVYSSAGHALAHARATWVALAKGSG
jgi:hypothetical protein